jgi:carbonic anhydrase/acetyltransferase-like protein (isoleucine patch superfamily)
MAPRPPKDPKALQAQLERLAAALGEPPRGLDAPAPPPPPPAPGAPSAGRALGGAGLGLGLGLVAVGIATRSALLILFGALLAMSAAVLRASSGLGSALAGLPLPSPARDPSRAHVGVGADVAADAVIEPGAVVEMGATVRSGAVVKRGAVVRMGATVGARAVLEEGAVVGWGADVHAGAVVGPDAVVGAGATVHRDAHVPAGTRMMPGASWASGQGKRAPAAAGAPAAAPAPARTPEAAPAPVPAPAPAPVDPRVARMHDACARIEAELRMAPEAVRAHLGASAATAQALRQTCLGLLERERLLRAESSPEALAFLAQERAELERRIAASGDEAVRRSLSQAVEAIGEQQRQRAELGRSAERLDAELTRLVWTLDGMAAQLVRLRTAGQEAAGPPGEAVLQSMQQLHDEIDAITEALEHVARGEPAPAAAAADARTPAGQGPEPLAPVEEGGAERPAGARTRERT